MGTEYAPDALIAAVRGLRGARLAGIDRLLGMVRIGLVRGGDEVRLHVQCPVRLVNGDRILLGSADLRHPPDRGDAFDRSARTATGLFGKREHTVVRAEVGPGGALVLETTGDLRIEVFPDVSGPIECWRLFVHGVDEHFVYRGWPGPARAD